MSLRREIALAVGRTGFGKSALTKELVGRRQRVIILEKWSDKDEYGGTLRFKSWAELLRAFKTKKPTRFRVSFSPGLTYFPHVCALAWVLGDVLLVIEEASSYFPGGKVPPEFIELCERGRHRQVSIYATAQRPKRLPIILRAEADLLYCFRLNEKADRDWVAEFPGADRQLAEQAAGLERYRYMAIDSNGGVRHGATKKL